MPHTVVAIDLGASSGRVMAGTLSDAGILSIEECSRFPNRPVHVPRDGGHDLQWDVLSLWKGIRSGLREAASRGPVEAIGIDTWGVDYGLLDADGRLIGNPSAYRSSRTQNALSRVAGELDLEWFYAHNGIQFQPFNTVYQLVADTERTQNSLAETMLLLPDLLGYWLTGRKVCEVTNASTTGLLDPETRTWNTEIVDALRYLFSVDVPALLPPLVEPGTILGTVTLSRADLRTQAGEPTPLVAVGSHDTASAVVAVPAVRGENFGADEPAGTFGFVSSGTWSLVGVELRHPVRSAASRAANFTNELGVDGTVRYLKNIMGMWVQQEYLRECREKHAEDLTWDTLNAEAAAAPALRTVIDINDPVFLAPGDMTDRIGAAARAADEPVPRTRGEYLRAITDSLVVAYRSALREAAELSGSVLDVVHIVGGGSKNALLCQLTADATGVPVVAGPDEGTAIGNMVVQLRAIGALDGDLSNIRRVVARSVQTKRFEPEVGAASVWAEAERRVGGLARTTSSKA